VSKKIKAGIIGTGFIGAVHVDALRRIGYVELVALAEAGQEMAERKAREFYIPKAYGNYEDLINDPEVQVVHNCTPNNLHLEINSNIIRAGKHVFSEKPLAMNAKESRQMLDLLKQHKVVHGVNFNYRMYPLVQDMKQRIRKGELGDVWLIHGSYLQDWLLYETDYNWRIEPEISGRTRAVGDLGSHWCDTVQAITGHQIVEVMADFSTVIPVRKKSRVLETFSQSRGATDYEEKAVKTEDWAAVLLRFDNGAKGMFSVSEVCAGRKCFLNIEIDGSKQSLYWNQEQGDQIWVGNRSEPNQVIIRDPNALDPKVRQYAFAPAGHPEGWLDDNKNSVKAFYDFIHAGKDPEKDDADFATFKDGHDIMLILDAIAESNEKGAWVKVKRETE
jgi:predicted dehydrogenase